LAVSRHPREHRSERGSSRPPRTKMRAGVGGRGYCRTPTPSRLQLPTDWRELCAMFCGQSPALRRQFGTQLRETTQNMARTARQTVDVRGDRRFAGCPAGTMLRRRAWRWRTYTKHGADCAPSGRELAALVAPVWDSPPRRAIPTSTSGRRPAVDFPNPYRLARSPRRVLCAIPDAKVPTTIRNPTDRSHTKHGAECAPNGRRLR
jgi:hypothetical protein